MLECSGFASVGHCGAYTPRRDTIGASYGEVWGTL